MTYRRYKVLIGLGAAVLVGCATPPSIPVPPPASLAPPPLAPVPPSEPPALAQPIAPAASDTSALLSDQTQKTVAASESWKQRGLASWYGKRFNGRRTSSGERFSAKGFTAAHRTLPIYSYVRVRRVASGEAVIVRINDRGPFHPGRVVDLSYAAANKLGILRLGSAEVEMELATEEEWRFSGNSTTTSVLRK
nr:septal ring lytic transglycosylase RlpA family protein [Rhodoferax sp.]